MLHSSLTYLAQYEGDADKIVALGAAVYKRFHDELGIAPFVWPAITGWQRAYEAARERAAVRAGGRAMVGGVPAPEDRGGDDARRDPAQRPRLLSAAGRLFRRYPAEEPDARARDR